MAVELDLSGLGYNQFMELKLDLPREVVEALGTEPEREALEAVLLFLVREGKMSVARAGGVLGLGRQESVRWYTSHGFHYPDLDDEELGDELCYAARRSPGER